MDRAVPASPGPTLLSLLADRLRDQADDTAYTFCAKQGRTSLTWRALDEEAARIAVHLARRGVRAGDRVVLLFPPGLAFIRAFFGALLCGAVPIPLPAERHKRHQDFWIRVYRDTSAAGMLVDTSIAPHRPALQEALPGVAVWTCDEWAGQETRDLSEGVVRDVPDTAIAYLQYTSGSTRQPQGVVLTHGAVVANLADIDAQYRHDRRSRIVSWLPHYHDMGLVYGILQPLYSGATAFLMSPASFSEDPLSWVTLLSEVGGTHSGAPNFAYDLAAERVASRAVAIDLSSWAVAFSGAEMVRAETIEKFTRAYEPYGFSPRAWSPAYGLAEATLKVSTVTPGELTYATRPAVDPSAGARVTVGCGRPEGKDVRIVDPEQRVECARGSIGEVWVHGPSVARGYWGQPAQTAEVFEAVLADAPGVRYLRTGDLGFLDADGVLFIVGRVKDTIVVRGENHYAADIEASVAGCHAALRPVAAAVAWNTDAGDGAAIVVQEARRRTGVDFPGAVAAIRDAVNREHGLALAGVVLTAPGAIPRTTSGKIRRRACAEALRSGALRVLHEWWIQETDGASEWPSREALLGASPDECRALVAAHLRHALTGAIDSSTSDGEPLYLESIRAAQLSHQLERHWHVAVGAHELLHEPTVASLTDLVVDRLLTGAPDRDPIVPLPDAASAPLSFQQEAAWFLQKLEPSSHFYNETQLLELRGAVDVDALERSVSAVLARHEVLRSVVVDRGVERVQEVRPAGSSAFVVETVAGSAAWEADVANRAAEQSRTVFDLARGPLLRVRVLRGTTDQIAVIVTAHHLVADGWSVGIFLRELGALYGGEPVKLPPVAVQYGAYAAWQRATWARGAHDASLAYWRERLTGVPVVTLPTDRPRPAVQQYTGAEQRVRYDAALVERLQARGRAAGTTLFMTLLAAWQIWLARQTGETDLPVATAMANRPRAELEGVIGFFANTVVIRTQWTGNPQLAEVLEQVRVRTLEALAHQEVPFEKVVEAVQPGRDLSRMPLAQVMVVLQNLPAVSATFAGLEVRRRPVPRETTKFDVTVIAEERDGGVEAAWVYNASLYDAATVAGWAAQYARVLEALGADPAQRVADLSLLTPSDVARLTAWNETARAYDATPVPALVAAQAQRTPARAAVVAADGVLTYEELQTQARQLAWWLRAQGIGAETIVGLHAERVRGVYAALLGVLQAGGAYLPLDPLSPPARLHRVLSEARPVLVLSTMVEQLEAPPGLRVIDLHAALVEAAHAAPVPLPDLLPSQAAYVLYTSGSTGQPKGVVVEHRQLSNYVAAFCERIGIDAGDRVAMVQPLSVDSPQSVLFPVWVSGATLHAIAHDVALDGRAFADYVRAHAITSLKIAPSHLTALMAAAAPDSVLPSRWVVIGGEASSHAWASELVPLGVGRVMNHYGPTETTVGVSTFEIAPGGPQRQTTPIGRPLGNCTTWILDGARRHAPIGAWGELFIGGANVARGYLNNPAATAERFVPDPFGSPGARLYATGDRVRHLSDGAIEFGGRLDDQIKINGIRIELGEIEAALSAHPQIREAAVVVVPTAAGQGTLELAALLVAPDADLDEGDLRAFLGRQLPAVMVPRRFSLVAALPRSRHGKLDRAALRTQSGTPLSRRSSGQPATAAETQLASIWGELLRVGDVTPSDDFFARGGHSLLAARLIAHVQQEFGVALPIRTVFEKPVLRDFAEHVELAVVQSLAPDELMQLVDRIRTER